VPHGASESEVEDALHAPMPEPHCEGPWRQSVGGLILVSLLVFGMSLKTHYDTTTTAQPMAALATPAPIATENPAMPQAMDPNVGAQPVAATLFGSQAPAATFDRNVRQVAGNPRTAFNFAARTVRPAVVGIRAAFGPPNARTPTVQRVGSGVVVDAAGYIVTCNHVVSGARSILITPYRRPEIQLSARLIAAENDLALLKVESRGGLPTVQLADSEQARVGDWVLAVGHPFGLGLTVTAGIIGRRQGQLGIAGQNYTGLIQTDAPINEGSSGGPLVDLNGQVIGLNTAIYAPTGVFSGAGFAIPSNDVRAFLARNLPQAGRAAGGVMGWRAG